MANDSNPQIPEDLAPEVLTLASRLYAERSQTYSLQELQQAGMEVQIPPELIQQALQEIQAKRLQEQKRKQTIKIALASAGAVIVLWGIVAYNSFSGAAARADAAWAQVENQLQRRADLIPNLVSVTKAYAKQEQDLAQQLIQSRESYLQADTPDEKAAATSEVSESIRRFQALAVQNPQLQSTQAFTNLQYELAGTENRLAVERMRYNQAVQAYNQSVQGFPNGLMARILGFQPRPFFQAETKAAPRIEYQN